GCQPAKAWRGRLPRTVRRAASDRDQSRFPVFDLENPETGFDPAKPFGQAIGARMHDSAPWKTEETIVGLPSLLILSVFSRFGGCHLSPPCVSLRRRQNTHRYLRPPIFPGRECLAETFFPSARQLVRRLRDQAALRTGAGNACAGSARSRRQSSSSPLRRAASSAAKANTPCGDQLIPWCLQRADTAQSLYFSTRVLAIHNPARCRCW